MMSMDPFWNVLYLVWLLKKSSLLGVIRNFYDAEVLAIWEVSSSMYHS